MATMHDVLAALLRHPGGALSQTVADALWPDGSLSKRGPGRAWSKPHHGGPTGGQRAAAGLLGKLKRKGLVFGQWRDGDPRTWWRLTEEGRRAVSKPPNVRGNAP